MKKYVDAMGDACPIPVVKTKKALKELGQEGGQVETLVDNEIAVQNLTKMAKQKGYDVISEKLSDAKFRVLMTMKGEDDAADDLENTKEEMDRISEAETENLAKSPEASAEEPVICIPNGIKEETVVVISSEYMGEGDPALGKLLMKSFIYAIAEQDTLPSTMLFYNGGAKLTCVESPALEDIKSLEAQGVEILTCGTCLNHYGLSDQLKVGSVTNMYVIAEKMTQAFRIVKP